VTLPAGPDALDAAWIEDVLRDGGAFPSARVRRTSAQIIGAGFGFVGVVARVTLEGDDVPPTIVAKWCSAKDAAAEARFHRDIAPALDLDLAAVFGTDEDAAAGRAVLLFADVAPSKQGDVLVGATPAEAAALVDSMARFHSRFWRSQSDPALAGLRRWGVGAEDRIARTTAGLPRFLELWGDRLPPAARAAARALPSRLPAAYDVLRIAPTTLIHADLHLDNVLFREGGTPVILDWTDAARGPVAADLARLLVDGLPAADRRPDVRRRLVERYVAAMESRDAGGLAVGDVLADVGRMATIALAAEVRAVARRAEGRGDPLPDHPRVPVVVDAEISCIADAAAEMWPGGEHK